MALGVTFKPDQEIYCELENYGQTYRKGSIFTPKGAGITLGKTVATRLTGNVDYDRFLIQHETGHLADINKLGGYNFYAQTIREYAKFGFTDVYTTPGTLEYSAELYGYQKLGYYYTNNGISFIWK
ncbi:MAG: hypothetical protein QM534_05540 [Sediminibacterium sp.]|nr:hypothetical protein [Sediminibacterium sp.]